MFNWLKKKNKNFQEKDLLCPRCKIVMRKIKKNDVIIDVCNRCNGIWLDDNEIEKLVEFGKKEFRQEKVKKNKKR